MNRLVPIRRLAICVLLASVLPALAGVPTVMNYQGRLTDNTPQQNPIDGSVPMEFRIYDAASGGELLWSESWPAVVVNGGVFSVLLGSSGSPLPTSLFATNVRYLEVIVDGESLVPRQQLGSVPYAFEAKRLALPCSDGQWLQRVDGEWTCADLAVCSPGTFTNCYSGPGGTAGVGACRSGTAACRSDGTGYESCTGEVLPAAEVCLNGVDEDCDGVADDGCACPGNLSNCGGQCSDLQSDPQNCGACGNACGPGNPCVGGTCQTTTTYGGVVTNDQDPTQPGPGIPSVWSYAGQIGVAAGDAMCDAAGSNHVCTYDELQQASAVGELDGILQSEGLSFWVHRVSTTVQVGQGDSPPGAGGRCNDWTYPTNHISDGEFGAVSGGRVDYFFDQDTTFSGSAADGHAGSGPDDGGPCGGAPPRAILCCNCPGGLSSCDGTCTDTQSDTQNCGACGNACGGGQTCVDGTCMAGGPIFAGSVSNETAPGQPGPGLSSVWSFAGQLGIAAGDAMCQDIGGDHACTYAEVVAADSAGELEELKQTQGLTFWVHRVATAVDVGGVQSPPGPGGRCNDWTYPTNHIADGEYGRVSPTEITFFFDQDTVFSGIPADGHAGSGPNDGGMCGGAEPRALLCCN